MHRPLGILLIAAFFVAWGLYLLVAGTALFVSPGLLLNIAPAVRVRYGLELGGPYLTLTVGALFARIGCGLLFRNSWARRAAMLPFIFAISAGLADALVFGVRLRLPSLLAGLQIVAETVIIWYLFRRPTADYFQKPMIEPQ